MIGGARKDADFTDEGDRGRYIVGITGRSGPFRIDAELRYRPVAFRWAQNLRADDAEETRRFVTRCDAMSTGSPVVLAQTTASVP